MKIKKVFESNFYTKCQYPADGWIDGDPISEIDREKILSTFPDIHRGLKDGVFKYRTKSSGVSKPGKNILIKIFSGDDEWYYLKINDRIVSPFDGVVLVENVSRFKCDQWDGLIDCIKNEVIDKIGK